MSIKQIKNFILDGSVDNTSYYGKPYYFEKDSLLFSYSKLIPGYFYVFNSLSGINEDDISSLDEYQTKTSLKKPYFDIKPIILSLGQEGPFEVGLNIKLLPNKIRKWFIQQYLTFLMSSLESFINSDGNFIELNEQFKISQNNQLFQVNRSFIKQISNRINFNLEFLIDKYKKEEMSKSLSLIDWDSVPLLSYCEYTNDGTVISKTPISYFLTKFT